MPMGFLNIESRAFQTLEKDLDLPAFAINLNSFFGTLKRDKDLIVLFSIFARKCRRHYRPYFPLDYTGSWNIHIHRSPEDKQDEGPLSPFGITLYYLEILPDPWDSTKDWCYGLSLNIPYWQTPDQLLDSRYSLCLTSIRTFPQVPFLQSIWN